MLTREELIEKLKKVSYEKRWEESKVETLLKRTSFLTKLTIDQNKDIYRLSHDKRLSSGNFLSREHLIDKLKRQQRQIDDYKNSAKYRDNDIKWLTTRNEELINKLRLFEHIII